MRYCPRCASEVEDVGGFCLLGHPLRLEPLIPSVSHIRAEVDRAFDEAYRTFDAALEEATPEPEPSLEPVAAPTPPPPPLPEGHPSVWEVLEGGLADLADPISEFAPPSRMDWGPERPTLLDQLPLRRRERPATA